MNLKGKNLVNRVKSFVYLEEDLVGKGATGKVYKGLDQKNGENVAIKVMEMSKIDNQVTEYLLACQKQALTSISNPYVLHAYDIIQMQGQCLIITPLCTGGTLKESITSKGKIPEQQALFIFVKLLRGYVSIKEKGFVHRDIKSSNVMFHNNDPIIIDFGYCEKIASKKPKMFYNVGSPSYMSPEAYFKTVYSQKSDLWALGIILYEMLEGYTIDHGQPIDRYFSSLLRHGFIFRSKISNTTKNMIKSILNPNPNQRPTTEQLIQTTERIIYSGNQPQQNMQQNSPLKSNKYQINGLNSQPLLANRISLKQNQKKNQQSIKQVFQDKLIQSREYYQHTQQQIPHMKAQLNKINSLQESSPTPIKMFESRNKNDEFKIKLSQSIYRTQNSIISQPANLGNQNSLIQPRFSHNVNNPQHMQNNIPNGPFKQVSLVQTQRPQYQQNQQQPAQNPFPLQAHSQRFSYQSNQNHQQNMSNNCNNQLFYQNNNQYQININPQRQDQNFKQQHQQQYQYQQHQQNQQHQQPQQPQLQQQKVQLQNYQQRQQFINAPNFQLQQNPRLMINNNQVRNSVNRNQLQVNLNKLTPQYRSMIQQQTTDNSNKLLNMLDARNIKVCHSKIFNSESVLTTVDPTKQNLSSSQPHQPNFNSIMLNNVSMTDSVHSRNDQLGFNSNLNVPRNNNPVVQSLFLDSHNNSDNNSFQVNTNVFRSIIVQKNHMDRPPMMNNHGNQIQPFPQNNQLNINHHTNNIKTVLQQPVPQFTQIRNSIGSKQLSQKGQNIVSAPMFTYQSKNNIQTNRPFSPIARQQKINQNVNEQRAQVNLNLNQLQRNFFKKTQPYFHMNANGNIHQQDHRQKMHPNAIRPFQSNQFMANLHAQNLIQPKPAQFQQNPNQQGLLARNTLPNFPRNNQPFQNYPPQRATISSNHPFRQNK